MVVSEGQRWISRQTATTKQAAPHREADDRGAYPELKRLVREAGLMKRQPRFYALTFAFALVVLAAAVAVLSAAPAWAALSLGPLLLAVSFGQLAFLGHDGGHRQIFGTARHSRLWNLLMTLLLGISMSWWVEKHNRHHSFPNALGVDPDIDLPVLAFSEEDAAGRRGLWRFFVRYQSYLLVPILALEGIGLRVASAQYIVRRRSRLALLEAALGVAHMTVYAVVLVALLGPANAAIVAIAHHLLTGIYLGSIFAPNHKGMELIDRDAPVSFLQRQLCTSRNISAHPVIDWLYGGQNFQIEHHLFPAMPRNNLRGAQAIVRAYCAERGLPYAETSVLGSYREIISYLHTVSAPLRARPV